MKTITLLLGIFLTTTSWASICSDLSGTDYEKCKVYIEGEPCSTLKGNHNKICRAYSENAGCADLFGIEHQKCIVYTQFESCSLLQNSTRDYLICKTFRDRSNQCSKLTGRDQSICKNMTAEESNCENLTGADWTKCRIIKRITETSMQQPFTNLGQILHFLNY